MIGAASPENSSESVVCVVAGLLLLARTPVDATYVIDLLPAMILIGLGAGLGFRAPAPRITARPLPEGTIPRQAAWRPAQAS